MAPAPRTWTWAERIAVGAVLAGIALLCVFPVVDYDFFWHAANGREMARSGHVVEQELFSFTRPGTRFDNHQWLAQLALYGVFSWLGAPGVVALRVAIVLACAVLLLRAATYAGAGRLPAACLVTLVVVGSRTRLGERPELFSLLGLSALACVLHGHRAGALRPRALVWVPVVLGAWDVLHGAIYGYAFLIAFCAGAALERRRAALHGGAPARGPLWIALGAALLVWVASPYGVRDYGFFWRYVDPGNALVATLDEAQPPTFAEFTLFYALLGASALAALQCVRRLELAPLLPALGFSLLGLRYLRVTAIFAFAAVPLLAGGIAWLGRTQRGRRPLAWASLAGLAAALGWIVWLKGPTGEPRFRLGAAIDEPYLPVGSARFLVEAAPQGALYHPCSFGGYFAFRLYPERRIFSYCHHTLFADLVPTLVDGSFRDRYGITLAVVNDPFELQAFFGPPGWVPVYLEPSAVVMARAVPENAALIATHGIRYFNANASDEALESLASQPAVLPALAREVAASLRFRHDARLATHLGRWLQRSPMPALAGPLLQALRFNGDSRALQAATRLVLQGS